MSSREAAHKRLAFDLNATGLNASQPYPQSAAAARTAILASLHGENSYRNQQLNTLQLQVDAWQLRRKPDYTLVYNTMRQLHDFPHDVLQPKEGLIYRHLILRDADEAEEFASIRDQHERIHALSNRLLQQLSEISHGVKPARRDRLRPQLQHFIDALRRLIDAEENDVLPTAEKRLQDSDWYALQTGISYLESVNTDDKSAVTQAAYQPSVHKVATRRQSVAVSLSYQAERVAASFSMAQLFAVYSLAETIGSFSECAEQLAELGVKQAKTGLSACLDEIMACRDTSSGVAELPGHLLRATLNNVSDTWHEGRQIVKENWQQDPTEKSRTQLLLDVWRSGQPLRLEA